MKEALKQDERRAAALSRAFRPDRECIQVAGQAIYIQEMDGKESFSMTVNQGEDFIFTMIARCLVDKDGERQLDDADIPSIKQWGQRKLRPIISAVLRVNGYGEDQEKNSEAGPSAG
jgi:membrane-bound lytic murein transglycosylase